ncbi:MAG: hypothetical protein ACI8SE_000461 [Bacteroidia bacterium]
MAFGTAKRVKQKMSNISAARSFLKGKCPQCHIGSIFKGGLFTKHFKDVHTNCPHCHVKFEQEPGFFWGAMYFSYSFIVGILIVLSVIMFSMFDDPSLLLLSVVIIGITLPLTPLTMRVSRMMLMYMAAPYRKYKPH